jgi:Flp pilus assembly protein TadG
MNVISQRRRQQRGVVLIIGIISLVLIVPLTGLAVDVGYLYASKSRLQAAVDGAALAAARSLNLGVDTPSQAATAQQNAKNWFYANFPNGNWATSGTTFSASVYEDASNVRLRHVDVTATTQAPTFFMKWLGKNAATVVSKGFASRRDSVVMMVLDRSGSMCNPTPSPCTTDYACGAMKAAAKLFVGQFAANRDYVGLVTFNDGIYVHSAPTQSFRTVLGYTDSYGNTGTGAIDTLLCGGGTNMASGLAIGYNELYKKALPGALNVLVLETDGQPNGLALNFQDGSTAGIANLGASNGCRDKNNTAKGSGGWNSAANARLWLPDDDGDGTTEATDSDGAGYSMNTGGTGYMANIPTGPIGSMQAADNPATGTVSAMTRTFHNIHTNYNDYYSSTLVSGCKFATTATDITDFAWLPTTDIFGNSLKPALNPYKGGVIMNGTRVKFDSTMTQQARWQNFRDSAANAVDHAGYRARSNATLPAAIMVIGLGGQSSVAGPDYSLLQRVGNDTQGDPSGLYSACASNAACVHYNTQFSGSFVYAPDTSRLATAFLKIASQVLRLSR